jgi:two-component system OmpR family response regulator
MRVLIVEDDDRTAAFLTKGFNQAGYAIDRAADGEEGLFMALNAPYVWMA